jgi:hypothetical protein
MFLYSSVCVLLTVGFTSCLTGYLGNELKKLDDDDNDNYYDNYFGNSVVYIKKLPDKTVYTEGEIFQPKGLEITIKITKGSGKEESENYSYSDPKHKNNFDFANGSIPLDVDNKAIDGIYYPENNENNFYVNQYIFKIPIKVIPK